MLVEVLISLLSAVGKRFVIAEDLTPHSTSFVPYSVRLAVELRHLHRRIMLALYGDKSVVLRVSWCSDACVFCFLIGLLLFSQETVSMELDEILLRALVIPTTPVKLLFGKRNNHSRLWSMTMLKKHGDEANSHCAFPVTLP